MSFAAAQFALSKPDPTTGKTRLKVLQEIREQTGVVAQELRDMPPLPPALAYLWAWFADLDESRPAGMGLAALSWADIAAYFSLHRIKPQPWEVETLRRIDRAYRKCCAEPSSMAAGGAAALKRQITGDAPE